jgi:cbb3-type cytochrome oxidase subunit 3
MRSDLAYFLFGATLCVLLAGIAVFYYRRSRKERVESPKYRMLDDDLEDDVK